VGKQAEFAVASVYYVPGDLLYGSPAGGTPSGVSEYSPCTSVAAGLVGDSAVDEAGVPPVTAASNAQVLGGALRHFGVCNLAFQSGELGRGSSWRVTRERSPEPDPSLGQRPQSFLANKTRAKSERK